MGWQGLFLMKLCLVGLLLALAGMYPSNGAEMPSAAPVVVELFTSEGCSSCPPADALLRQFDHDHEAANAPLIVLSEHVDYWNHIGWKDPYSSAFFSERQNGYAARLGLDSVYTPQMVVDGTTQFVGSDAQRARAAIDRAKSQPKLAIQISSVALENPGSLRLHVDAGTVPRAADVYVALALNHAESQVLRGENEGRKLSHSAVVKSISKIGRIGNQQPFSQDVQLKLDPHAEPSNLRVIVLAQEPGQGKIVGAAVAPLGK